MLTMMHYDNNVSFMFYPFFLKFHVFQNLHEIIVKIFTVIQPKCSTLSTCEWLNHKV